MLQSGPTSGVRSEGTRGTHCSQGVEPEDRRPSAVTPGQFWGAPHSPRRALAGWGPAPQQGLYLLSLTPTLILGTTSCTPALASLSFLPGTQASPLSQWAAPKDDLAALPPFHGTAGSP